MFLILFGSTLPDFYLTRMSNNRKVFAKISSIFIQKILESEKQSASCLCRGDYFYHSPEYFAFCENIVSQERTLKDNFMFHIFCFNCLPKNTNKSRSKQRLPHKKKGIELTIPNYITEKKLTKENTSLHNTLEQLKCRRRYTQSHSRLYLPN